MTIKELKQGDYFTKKAIEYPTENQVWVRGEYCREAKKYFVYRFSDVNDSTLMSGTKEVFVDFVF